MKTIFSNKSGEALEVANQVMYSLKVLLIGLFIPFAFVFGISYNMDNAKTENSVSISQQSHASNQNNTVDLEEVLSGKNS